MFNNVDGNIAALKAEEYRIEKQEQAWADTLNKIEDKLDTLQQLAEEIQSMGEHSLYEFSEDIDQEMRDRL